MTEIPRPVGARLVYSEAARKKMSEARGRRDGKRALQEAHDEVAASLLPKLEALKRQGLIIDFATSWLMAEAVVHAAPENLEQVVVELTACPELTDVTADAKTLRRRLRRV
jgi:DNA recombination-dependent growth factor C